MDPLAKRSMDGNFHVPYNNTTTVVKKLYTKRRQGNFHVPVTVV